MNKNNRMSKRLLNYVIVLLVCLISSAESFAQGTKFQVKGNVTDASREPIVGATIKVKGTSQGVITNIDGEYSIDTRSNAILEFSYIGYVSQEVPVSGSKIINVTLQEEVSKLDEVVVVGYGTQKKISVTGSVSNVSTKEIAKIATPSLSNTLGGQIPGIVTRQATGEPGYDQASIYIRGFGTWTNRSPLILVDGIERDMNTINTEEVESISVLKDASATAVYGVRGANGVILITTKRGQLGKPKVTLRSEYAVLTGLRYPEYINAAEYAGLMNEARDNAGVANMAYTDEEIELFRNGSSPYLYPNVNWVDEVLKKNTTQSITNLNITGGTEVVRYFVNVGYTTQSGLYRDNGDNAYSTNSRVNRYNYRSRVDVNLTKDLSVELGVGGIIQNRNFPGKSQYDIFYAIRNTSPLAFPVKNPDGTPGASPTYLGNITISVIIPVYNASVTLPHCLESLHKQTYRNLELLFVDDCSTDESLYILTSYAEQFAEIDFTIRILQHERNRGVAAARNTALKCATGDYIYYVDADDSIEPHTLECLVNEINHKGLDIVGHEWYLTFNSNARYMKQPAYTTSVEALRKMMGGVMRWNLWLFLVRRSLYVENDIRFTEGLNMGEDMMVMMKLFICAGKVGIVHRPFYHYRQSNPESLTKIYSQEHIIQVANNVYEVEKYVNASAYADSLIEFIPFLKLNIKLPLLITDDKSHYEQWLECFPEANCYVMNNKLLPLRTRIIQWMAVKRYFILLRLYYRTVFKLVYGIIYK